MNALLAAIYDPFMQGAEDACLRDWRRELLADLRGDVLEIGAGQGANLAFLGGPGRRVLTEPAPAMRSRLEAKARALGVPVEIVDAPADALPFPDGSFDEVVSTLVLCSVPDVPRALGEVARVLRPGGRLRFLEHVVAWDNPGRRAWQERLDPLWCRVAGGCHLQRDTAAAIEAAGFTIATITRESLRSSFPWVRPSIRGVAVWRPIG